MHFYTYIISRHCLGASGELCQPGFPIRTSFAISICRSPRCFLPSFESIGPLVQEKKRKVDFQDGRHGHHLGFQIGMILDIVDLQVTPMLPIKFQVNWPFGSGEEANKRFSSSASGELCFVIVAFSRYLHLLAHLIDQCPSCVIRRAASTICFKSLLLLHPWAS